MCGLYYVRYRALRLACKLFATRCDCIRDYRLIMHRERATSTLETNRLPLSLFPYGRSNDVHIVDPSLTIGKRKEIDNVMKKARGSNNEYWDKKLLEAEEKDPNRWRHTGYKKMYIGGESSSESDREFFRYNRNRSSRSRSPRVARKSPTSPSMLRSDRRRSPISPALPIRRRSPRSPDAPPLRSRQRSPPPEQLRRRPRSPPEPTLRRKTRSPRSPVDSRRRTPPSPVLRNTRRSPPVAQQLKQRPAAILPRSKRPPSPPPKVSSRSYSLSTHTILTLHVFLYDSGITFRVPGLHQIVR